MSLPIDIWEIIFRYDNSLWKSVEDNYKGLKKKNSSKDFESTETIITLERTRLKFYFSRKIKDSHAYHYIIYINKNYIMRDTLCVKNQSKKHAVLRNMLDEFSSKVPLIQIMMEILYQ